jgi:hypothetical protein
MHLFEILIPPQSSARPEDGGGISSRNVGKPCLDSAVCPRKFHWILSPRKASRFIHAFLVFPQFVWVYKHWSRYMIHSLSQHCKLHSQCVLNASRLSSAITHATLAKMEDTFDPLNICQNSSVPRRLMQANRCASCWAREWKQLARVKQCRDCASDSPHSTNWGPFIWCVMARWDISFALCNADVYRLMADSSCSEFGNSL